MVKVRDVRALRLAIAALAGSRVRSVSTTATTSLWLLVALPSIGYAAAAGTEVLRSMLDRSRVKADREAEEQRARQQRREEFELTTLRDLYEALNDEIRLTVLLHLKDLEIAKKAGKYASHQIGDEELAESERAAGMRSHTLQRLILDDDLRAQVGAARTDLSAPGLMLNSDPDTANQVMEEAFQKFREAQMAIAARIRELYR